MTYNVFSGTLNPTHFTSLATFGDFLRPVFPASRVQHVSDPHPKFALRPHHVWKYGRHIQSSTAEIRRGKKERTNDRMKIYMVCPITRAAIKKLLLIIINNSGVLTPFLPYLVKSANLAYRVAFCHQATVIHGPGPGLKAVRPEGDN